MSDLTPGFCPIVRPDPTKKSRDRSRPDRASDAADPRGIGTPSEMDAARIGHREEKSASIRKPLRAAEKIVYDSASSDVVTNVGCSL
jgi:hypothetical protein